MKRFLHPLPGILAIIALVLACGTTPPATSIPSSSEPPPATVSSRGATFEVVENNVLARSLETDDFAAARVGQLLPVAGQARTGDESFARLDFLPGGTILRLGPNTEFTLTELSDESEDFFTRLWMEAGELWIILTGGEMEVETPLGTAAVRGSLMSISYSKDEQKLTATCLEGDCSLENPDGTAAFTAGQASDILGVDQAPASARDMTEQEYQDWYEILREFQVGPRIGDTVWLDMNLNGIQDEDEEGVADIEVYLYEIADGSAGSAQAGEGAATSPVSQVANPGNLVDSTITDEEGHYSFPYPATGTYYLLFELPADFVFSPQDMGEDDAVDSDPDPATGQTTSFDYIYGEEHIKWDAGLVPYELAPTTTPTNTPEPTPTNTPKPPPPPCGCYTAGVKFDVVKYDGNPGWSDCGQATACHSIIGDQLVTSGTIIGTGGSCEMKVICPSP